MTQNNYNPQSSEEIPNRSNKNDIVEERLLASN